MRREKRFLENEERYRADQERKRARKPKNANPSSHDTADNSSSLRRGERSATAGLLSASGK
jgi:hypothetical protein